MEKAMEYYIKARKSKKNFNITKITCKEDAYAYAKYFYSDDIHIYESFFIMMLDRANNVKGWAKISQGGICGTVVDIKIVCKYAIESLCNSIIMVHNHPSGNLKASNADIDITKKIEKALKLFEIELLDHIIITDNGYNSIIEKM